MYVYSFRLPNFVFRLKSGMIPFEDCKESWSLHTHPESQMQFVIEKENKYLVRTWCLVRPLRTGVCITTVGVCTLEEVKPGARPK